MDKKLLYKPDMKLYEVFDVKTNRCGFPTFLIYRNGQWVYRSAKHFAPNEPASGASRVASVLGARRYDGGVR